MVDTGRELAQRTVGEGKQGSTYVYIKERRLESEDEKDEQMKFLLDTR